MPVPSMSNNVVQSTPGYPSLVICESPTRGCGVCTLKYRSFADPSVYPWIDVYPSAAGGSTRPPSSPLSPSSRQPRTRSPTHTRAKPRNWFTADENAPPVPKLPSYATPQAISPASRSPPQHSRKFSTQEHLAYPVISICD